MESVNKIILEVSCSDFKLNIIFYITMAAILILGDGSKSLTSVLKVVWHHE